MKSPLRYPGGKSRAVDILADIMNKHFKNKYKRIISPFCGGCSFEFKLSQLFKTYEIICYDAFEPLIIFWNEAKNNNHELCDLIADSIGFVDKSQFIEMRNDLKTNYERTLSNEERLIIAAEYFIINRCSFSGSTCSGGYSNEAMMRRFTPSSVEAIRKLNLSRFTFIHDDYEKALNDSLDTFIFCDPPYHVKSKLYGIKGDLHEMFDHQLFHDMITSINMDYMITYNDDEYIRNLYSDHLIIPLHWSYGMNKTHESNEIVIIHTKTST